ncbi:hypothetical protein COY17_04040 [Candidatus Saccharibacteria bacterium CG_4_10_14_0_2_um_filter_52_9]|nr:MAG: hypothetical protein COY17_04040 [Candidatus Saccharibacteria bacterium CG_4_10_14_0_2_um_filter_52_9]
MNRRTQAQLQRDALKDATLNTGHYWLQRFGLLVLLVAALASAVNILSLSSNAKVLPLTSDKSALLRTSDVYETAANKLLAGSVWNRNKITINTASVSQRLMEQFPELSDVSVTIPLLAHRPLIYVQPAQPALVLVNASGAYIVATSGKVLLKGADVVSLGQPQLPSLTDQSGLPLKLNKQALTAANVGFVQEITAQLAAKQLTIASMTLPASASELDVQLAGQPYIVKFNLQANDARKQAGALLATLNELRKQNATPAKYIDVRISGRAYYQ